MDNQISKAASLNLVGTRICLDFLNTGEWYDPKGPRDYLTDYSELVKWAGHAGILKPEEVNGLVLHSQNFPEEANKVHKTAIKIRSTLLRMFLAFQQKEEPKSTDIEFFNNVLSKAMRRLKLSIEQGKLCWKWQESGLQLDKMITHK